jgi:hypothetical protein
MKTTTMKEELTSEQKQSDWQKLLSRRKILTVRADDILQSMIRVVDGNCPYLDMMKHVRALKKIPKDAKVVSVYNDYSRNAFGIVIVHPSFAVVPEGCYSPEIETEDIWKRVKKGETEL